MHRSSKTTHHTPSKIPRTSSSFHPITVSNHSLAHRFISDAHTTLTPRNPLPVSLQLPRRHLSTIASTVVLPTCHYHTMPTQPPTTPSSSSRNPNLRTAKSFHAPGRQFNDPRKTRTMRCNTSSKARVLSLQLCTTPVVSILLLPEKTPTNALVTAQTAVSAHGHWRVVATGVRLPACFTVTCHASELDSRLLRVCVFGGRRGGDFVIPVRSVLGRRACVDVGKRGCLDVRGVVGSFHGRGIGVGLSTGMSVMKEMKGCSVRARRVGGGRIDVCLGQWDFGKEGFCRVNISGEVLWFGIGETDGTVVRVALEIVRRKRFGGEEVVGEMQIGLEEIGKVEEGEILKVGWWRGGVQVVVLGVVEMVRTSLSQVVLEMRLTR